MMSSVAGNFRAMRPRTGNDATGLGYAILIPIIIIDSIIGIII